MKKIDVFYKNSKGEHFYLHSTIHSKTCKEAVSKAKNSNLKPYASKVGETIQPERIYANFDKEYKK